MAASSGYRPEGEWEQVAEYDGWPNGLKIHRDGRIFITDYKRGIMLLDPASGAVTPFLETAASESFKGVNDLVFAASGNLYFTDQGQTGMHDPTGRVWKLTPDGRLTCLVNTIPSPNGIVVDPEESFLLVAVTRANQIWRVPLPASGLVTKVGIFAHLHGGPGGPDGLALDAEGNLLICHTGFGSVWRLSPVAEPLDRIVSCAGVGHHQPGLRRPENGAACSSPKAGPERCCGPSWRRPACRCSRTPIEDQPPRRQREQRLRGMRQRSARR